MALRYLLGERIRLGVSLAGVAVPAGLILFQLALQHGINTQISIYLQNQKAPLWVLQEGVRDLVSVSVMPRSVLRQVALVPGVERAVGMVATYVNMEVKDRQTPVSIVAFDPRLGGGPWKLAGLERPPTPEDLALGEDEVIVDEAFALKNGLRVGDRISLPGTREKFTVVAYSRETNTLGSQYLFVSHRAAGKILPGGERIVTAVMVYPEPGVDPASLAAAIESRVQGVNAVLMEEVARRNREYVGAFFLPIIGFGMLVGFLVGLTVTGLTLYHSIMEKVRELALMKALGLEDRWVGLLILTQGLLIGLGGFVLGVPLGLAGAWGVSRAVPGLNASLTLPSLLLALLLSLLMAGTASLLPLLRLRKVDPASVFRP